MMKKIFIYTILFLLLYSGTIVLAKNKDSITLKCSYIVAKTDFNITLKPITIKNNGDAYMDNKYVGKAYKTGENMLYLPMEKGALMSIDFEK